jgi:hypothetical protein
MYRILYNDSTIFDPYGNENEVVTDASMSVEINAAAYMDFTMSRPHPLYNMIAERDGVVTLYWDENVLFQGVIESIDIDIQGNKAISCVSALDYLNDTVVRPYSTIAGEQELTAPSSVDGYFQWLIDQHNEHVLDSGKRFDVGVNQGANLQQNNFIYRSSTNNPTTASEISDQLLDALGGYLTMRYVDDRYVLDLYADLHTMNAQIVDFGVNITDFSKTIDTKDQYTALILKGGSPEFQGGDFESGDWSHWVTHPNEPLVRDKTHGGDVSSYFVSGTGEYVNDSFFYFRSGRRYKATVYVKNERGSNVTIHGSYQYEQSGTWTTVNVGTSLTVENKDDQWVEFSFDFQPNLSEYTKIRPRWYFDNVANDGNRRVYLDDFSFSQVSGDTDVAEDPIRVSMVPDGGTQYDSNILKTGDVIYDPSSVSRYGYKEEVYEDSTITDVDDLLQAGIKELNKLKDPQIGLDIKAVDLALFMEGYTHLNVGDAVRVRSAIHDTDELLMVNSITLDLQDPGQSEYNIGKAYDSLTGQQSGFLRSLNSGINSSLDAVTSLDQTTKDQAIQIGKVENVANDASNKADNANTTANKAQTTANNASSTANNAHNTANNASLKADEAKETANNASLKADEAQNAADNASLKAAEAKTTADGKNKVFTQTEEPEHTELTNGDLWQKLDSSGHISSVNVWNGTKFTAYSLVADSLLVPGSVNGSVLIKDGTVEAKNIKIGNGEILTELLKARKIVTDDVEAGQFKGYVFTGAIFQSSEAENTGMKLNSTALQMWDSNHNRTVYLDGEGVSNVLTGTFQTGLSGNRVMISPSFKQSEIAGSDKFEGAGIQFYHGTDAYAHPYIAVESTTQQEGEVSALTFNGGHRVQNDPGAFGRIGERKDDAGKKFSVVYFYAQNNYDESVSDNQAGARLILEGHPEGGNTFAALEAYDANGKVGVQADITRGFLYLSGFIKGFTGRATFLASFWKAWWGGSGTGNYSAVTLTYTPAKYGYYRWIVNPAVVASFATAHTGNDTASSTEVYGYGERGQDVYVSALACLYK